MTPVRFKECLDQIHWSLEALAESLGCDERQAEAYSLGLAGVPSHFEGWLEALAQAHAEAQSRGQATGSNGKRELLH